MKKIPTLFKREFRDHKVVKIKRSDFDFTWSVKEGDNGTDNT